MLITFIIGLGLVLFLGLGFSSYGVKGVVLACKLLRIYFIVWGIIVLCKSMWIMAIVLFILAYFSK